ncbi:MAG: hypothetical protein QW734_02085 [Candidatus Bathyarchaeia archaeon]
MKQKELDSETVILDALTILESKIDKMTKTVDELLVKVASIRLR